MKYISFLVAGCVALMGGFALSLAQSSALGPQVVGIAAWSRPDVIAPHGIQVRRQLIAPDPNSGAGTAVRLRFEPIPAATVQSLTATTAANGHLLAYHASSIEGAAVFVDALQDGLPGRWCKAVRSKDDPRAFEVVLPCPIGGWYNQPLRVMTSVWADGAEVIASDTTLRLAP
jgi:hypothetical protein